MEVTGIAVDRHITSSKVTPAKQYRGGKHGRLAPPKPFLEETNVHGP